MPSTMGRRKVFNISFCMQGGEHMGGLSNPAESVIIMDVNVENKKVFHRAFSTFFLSGDKNNVENAFWTQNAYYTYTEG